VPNLIKAMPVGDLWATRNGFVLLTITTSALSLVGGAIPLLMRNGPYPFPSSKAFSCRSIPDILCRSPGCALAILAYCGHMWELYAVWSSVPSFLLANLAARGYPTAEATYQAALYSFFIIAIGGLGCVCCAVLAQRWGRIAVCALCSAASGACCLLVGPASNPASAATLAPTVALLLFWGFVVLPDSPQYTTLVIELVEPSVVGTALVLQQALGYLVTIPTIFIMPLLADDAAFGWQRAYSVLAPGARARRVRAARHLPKMQPS
jgi:hypothetical protein